MKIFLTGASGMLAAEVMRKLREERHELFPTDLKPRLSEIKLLDIKDSKEVLRLANIKLIKLTL